LIISFFPQKAYEKRENFFAITEFSLLPNIFHLSGIYF